MRASGGSRIGWHQIPRHVRAAIEGLVGEPVVEARNQAGGFSPGVAARCRLAGGSRVFVKAVSPDQNPQACRIHRREAEVAGRLPDGLPVPRLRHVHDDGHWVALVFDDVEGRQPHEPWSEADLDRVIPAIRDFSRSVTPSPVDDIQSVQERHRPVFDGWRRLHAGDGDPSRLSAWALGHLGELAEVESGWERAAGGDALLHADLRADNVLIDRTGKVWLVDWPWACVGAAFVDLVFLLPSVGLGGGPDPVSVVDRHGLFDGIPTDDVRIVATALAGFFQRAALDPPPPGLPAIRAFQQAQADVAIRWLQAMWT